MLLPSRRSGNRPWALVRIWGGVWLVGGWCEVGLLGVGVLGLVFLGLVVVWVVEGCLGLGGFGLAWGVVGMRGSVLGVYRAVDPEKVRTLGASDQTAIQELTGAASKGALATTAVFPAVMLAGYLGLLIVFRTRGGYRAVALEPKRATGLNRDNRTP